MRLKKIITSLILCSAPLSGIASYTTPNTLTLDAPLKKERKTYQQALTYLNKGQRSSYVKTAQSLEDYPLYPYLKYKEYSRYIKKLDQETIEGYLQDYSNTPMAGWLRKQWIRNLAKQKKWDAFLGSYEPGQYSAEFDCHYYWALYKEGMREEAFSGARSLWLVGSSQHKACNPLFQAWKTTGEMDGQLAWERTELAMQSKKLQLAKFLEKSLPEKLQPLSREWREVYRNPHRLKQLSRYTAWGEQAKPIVITGFSRLIRKNPKLAQSLWLQYDAAFHFSFSEKSQINNEFATVLAIRRQENAEYWLSQASQNPNSHELLTIGLRHALYAKDWPRLQHWLALLGEEPFQESGWQYWQARAEEQLGPVKHMNLSTLQPDNPHLDYLEFHDTFLSSLYDRSKTLELMPESIIRAKFLDFQPKERFQRLSNERSYYGFLSSERLKRPLNLNQEPSSIEEDDIQRVSALPSMRRVQEFFLLGNLYLARAEWQFMINRMNDTDRSIAAQIAFMQDWHHPAIVAAYRSDAYNNLEIRFPTAYKSVISHHANRAGIELDWVYSLIRQESAFMPQANSSVGAMGMMQIMPRTAAQLARSLGIKNPSKIEMQSPETNIQLGTHYMSQLKKQFKGNLILATAAYNAGPHRAKAWQPKFLPVSGDLWVETIPFKETRNYVQNILTYQAIYRHRLGNNEVKLSTALSLIPSKAMTVTASR